MLNRLTWCLAAVLALSAFPLRAEISVSRQFQTHPLNQAVNVPAGGYWVWPLPGRSAGDSYVVRVAADNEVWKDISAFVVDERNLQLFKAGRQYRGFGQTQGIAPFEFNVTRPGTEQLYLLINNRYSLLVTKRVRLSVSMTTKLSEEEAHRIEGFLENMYTGTHELLQLPDFDVRVAPCNSINAYSAEDSGDITLCSEFWSKYQDKPSVLVWVFFHELGHTALDLWGIPGNDNEDIADEFATALSLYIKDGPRLVMGAMEFFEGNDVKTEAQLMVERGDRHSLSSQRIRNVNSWLLQPVRVTEKWNNLLYPHMTEKSLKDIIAKPGPYSNVQLASEQLATRAKTANVTAANAPILSPIAGCTKDTDCKGERICEHGACVNP
jgi:hypothetical protein